MNLISSSTGGLEQCAIAVTENPSGFIRISRQLQEVGCTKESASLALSLGGYDHTSLPLLMSCFLCNFFSPDMVVWVEAGEVAA